MSEKSRGQFDYLLTIDCETTGLCFNADTPVVDMEKGERHQAVSWGLIVTDSNTLSPVKEMYVEIKWNKYSIEQRRLDSTFGSKAEQIHQLSKEHLDQNGLTEKEAVEQIANDIIIPYWGFGTDMSNIRTLGHNVHMFDLPFLRDMFRRHQIELPFGNRHYDTNSAGFLTFGTWNSDELFELTSDDQRSETHNALDDAHRALRAARVIKTIFTQALDD